MRALLSMIVLTAGCGGALSQAHPYDAARFDAHITGVLDAWHVHGAAVAVTDRGKLVIARGYGHPGLDASVPTQPTTRFRIASLTKPITSVAIHRLHQEGRLDLDARVVDLLSLSIPTDGTFDERWRTITVRHLLQHTAGFDREASFDPMFANLYFAKEAQREIRPDDLDFIIGYMLRARLDFDPGSSQAYSNFGYALLGRVIERVTGQPYEAYVRASLLAPMGIARMEIGHERPRDRPADEAFYFPDETDSRLPNLFSPEHEIVSPSDGGFFMRPMEAHGGFIASAVDYARFLAHVDGAPSPMDVLTRDELELMLTRPALPPDPDDDGFYADGWDVIPRGEDRIWSHTGAKPGTTSIAVRLPGALCYVVLANGRPLEGDFVGELDEAVLDALAEISEFPGMDLFSAFGLPTAPNER